ARGAVAVDARRKPASPLVQDRVDGDLVRAAVDGARHAALAHARRVVLDPERVAAAFRDGGEPAIEVVVGVPLEEAAGFVAYLGEEAGYAGAVRLIRERLQGGRAAVNRVEELTELASRVPETPRLSVRKRDLFELACVVRKRELPADHVGDRRQQAAAVRP